MNKYFKTKENNALDQTEPSMEFEEIMEPQDAFPKWYRSDLRSMRQKLFLSHQKTKKQKNKKMSRIEKNQERMMLWHASTKKEEKAKQNKDANIKQ